MTVLKKQKQIIFIKAAGYIKNMQRQKLKANRGLYTIIFIF